MLENIEVLYHSSIRINQGKIIYVDPFKIEKKYNDADFIFLTHSHYDHFSALDINMVRKENTKIIQRTRHKSFFIFIFLFIFYLLY